MSQWYLSYDGNQIGPMDKAQALAKARKNPDEIRRRVTTTHLSCRYTSLQLRLIQLVYQT